MNQDEIQEHLDNINELTQFEMAALWRHAPIGHIYFNENLPFHEVFKKRFEELGGMNPSISKRIGWD